MAIVEWCHLGWILSTLLFSGVALHPSQVVLTAFGINVIGAILTIGVVIGVVVISVVVDTGVSVSGVLDDLQIGFTTMVVYTGLRRDGLHLLWMVGVVVNVVVISVIVVENGLLIDTDVLVDGIVVVNSAVFPYILIVVTAAFRRSDEAATPTAQRRRPRGWITRFPTKLLVLIIFIRINTVHMAINWTWRGRYVNGRAAAGVGTDNFAGIDTRSG